MTANRLQLLYQLMKDENLDAVAINPGPTLVYLTGLHFHLMERPTLLIISKDQQPIFILPELESAKVKESFIPILPFPYKDDPSQWQITFSLALAKSGLQKARIGVEPTRLRFLEINYLQNAVPQASFLSAEKLFSNLRVQKDEQEIASMQKAAQIAQDALRATLPMIKTGSSEKEIASELVINMLRLGNDPELPFAPIVAGGPNSANPHAVPTERELGNGDLLVIDWGASYQGYFSDLTRTFAIGQVDPELVIIYKTVQASNEAGRAAGRPGIAAGEVDKAARSVITKAGYSDFFTHRTGHGLGMEEHETPYIFSANEQVLQPGMVYTVEPGIYLPGRGGVRIEDDMVVTTSGSRSMSDYPRDLTFLTL
jgi:Xaa-Pro dipeptidase